MNKFASYVAGIAATAALGATAGCTVTTGSPPDGGIVYIDSGTGADSSSTSDTGTVDTGTVDTGTADAGGDADGGVVGCAVGVDTMVPACDMCIESKCCTQVVNCDMGADAGDGGQSNCEALVLCIQDCLIGNPDAGVAPGTLNSCESLCNTSYTPTEQQNADALVTCIGTQCAQQCQ